MTLTESRPNDLVTINVDFVKSFAGGNDSALSEGDQTAVTCTVSDHQNFIAKAFCLVMNGRG
jgi:hypothetical protein